MIYFIIGIVIGVAGASLVIWGLFTKAPVKRSHHKKKE